MIDLFYYCLTQKNIFMESIIILLAVSVMLFSQKYWKNARSLGFALIAMGALVSCQDSLPTKAEDEAYLRSLLNEKMGEEPTSQDKFRALYDCSTALKVRLYNVSSNYEEAYNRHQYWQEKVAEAEKNGVDNPTLLGMNAKLRVAEHALHNAEIDQKKALYFESQWKSQYRWGIVLLIAELVLAFILLRASVRLKSPENDASTSLIGSLVFLVLLFIAVCGRIAFFFVDGNIVTLLDILWLSLFVLECIFFMYLNRKYSRMQETLDCDKSESVED